MAPRAGCPHRGHGCRSTQTPQIWTCCAPALSWWCSRFTRSASSTTAWPPTLVSYGLYLSHIVSLWLSFTRLAFLPMPLRWAVFVTTVVCVPLTLYHSLEAPLIGFGNALVANFSQTGL